MKRFAFINACRPSRIWETVVREVAAVKLQECAKCGKQIAEGETVCPCCLKETASDAARELWDIAKILEITAGTDANIREAAQGITSIAEKLERGGGE